MLQAAKEQNVKALPRNLSGMRVAVRGPRYQPIINNGVDDLVPPPINGMAYGIMWAMLMALPFWAVVIYLF